VPHCHRQCVVVLSCIHSGSGSYITHMWAQATCKTSLMLACHSKCSRCACQLWGVHWQQHKICECGCGACVALSWQVALVVVPNTVPCTAVCVHTIVCRSPSGCATPRVCPLSEWAAVG
jgi:hypothetical protein